MCKNVAMLRLYPSIMASTVRHFLQLPIQGVVLQCYGSGENVMMQKRPVTASALQNVFVMNICG